MNERAFRLLLQATPNLSALEFAPFRPGVEKAPVFLDSEGGEEIAVLRYEPGASVPPHKHNGYEVILVLSGSQSDERGTYGAGMLVVNAPESQHTVVSSDGCVVLAIWAKPVTFQ